MNTKYLFGLFFIGLLVCSCKKELEPQESSVSATATPATPQQPANGAAMQQPVAANGQPMTVSPQQMQVQTSPAPPTAVAPGMNPAHGQPGHRCDIPVGAPLNSPPGKTTAQNTTTQATRITPTTSGTPAILNANPTAAAPVETKPGMNPPHGQPGHRCDIAVGAPLSSPPGNTAAATTPVKVQPKTESAPFTVSEPAKTEEKKAE